MQNELEFPSFILVSLRLWKIVFKQSKTSALPTIVLGSFRQQRVQYVDMAAKYHLTQVEDCLFDLVFQLQNIRPGFQSCFLYFAALLRIFVFFIFFWVPRVHNRIKKYMCFTYPSPSWQAYSRFPNCTMSAIYVGCSSLISK